MRPSAETRRRTGIHRDRSHLSLGSRALRGAASMGALESALCGRGRAGGHEPAHDLDPLLQATRVLSQLCAAVQAGALPRAVRLRAAAVSGVGARAAPARIPAALAPGPAHGRLAVAAQPGRSLSDRDDQALGPLVVLNTQRLFLQLLPLMRIDTVCDVGSMDGAAALKFRAAAPAARLHAFEPKPGNLRLMQANLALLDNYINIVPLAVTNYDGYAQLYVTPAAFFPGESWRGMSSLYRRFERQELLSNVAVKTARLDSVLAGELSPDLRVALWIDVEGKAHDVIEGAGGLMRHVCI